MIKKTCRFCKKKFLTDIRWRTICEKISCRIKLEYAKLAKKGQDPVLHFQNLIANGAEEKCCICETIFKPNSPREFITKICPNCETDLKKDKDERLIKSILNNPRKFLDSLK